MISAKELKDYIETLSTAHAAGHKCDKELRTAIELYTAEIGIKDIETQINEKISKESEKNAKTLLINFAGNYYDSERNEFKLMKAIEVHNDFKKWLEKKQ